MGKVKNGINKFCSACNKEFYVPQYRAKTAHFCSILCQNHIQYEKYVFNCQGCGKKCVSSPSRKYSNKKFCSLECREYKAIDDKERRKQIKAINIKNRGNIKARTMRKYISCFKEMKCEYCGYDEYDFCLDMHHIDHDPTNNKPENIGILCCMCHRKLHKGIIELNGELSMKKEVKKSDLKKLEKDIMRKDRKEDNKMYEKKHKEPKRKK